VASAAETLQAALQALETPAKTGGGETAVEEEEDEEQQEEVKVEFDGQAGIDDHSTGEGFFITTACTTAKLNTGDKVQYTKDVQIVRGLVDGQCYYVWKSAKDRKIVLFTTAAAAQGLDDSVADDAVVHAEGAVKVENTVGAGENHKLIVIKKKKALNSLVPEQPVKTLEVALKEEQQAVETKLVDEQAKALAIMKDAKEKAVATLKDTNKYKAMTEEEEKTKAEELLPEVCQFVDVQVAHTVALGKLKDGHIAVLKAEVAAVARIGRAHEAEKAKARAKVENLSFRAHGIGAADTFILAAFLPKCECLRTLNLAENNIGVPELPPGWVYRPDFALNQRYQHEATGKVQKGAPKGTTRFALMALKDALQVRLDAPLPSPEEHAAAVERDEAAREQKQREVKEAEAEFEKSLEGMKGKQVAQAREARTAELEAAATAAAATAVAPKTGATAATAAGAAAAAESSFEVDLTGNGLGLEGSISARAALEAMREALGEQNMVAALKKRSAAAPNEERKKLLSRYLAGERVAEKLKLANEAKWKADKSGTDDEKEVASAAVKTLEAQMKYLVQSGGLKKVSMQTRRR
jgi:hypothetical protein